jgi:hypothetical protein
MPSSWRRSQLPSVFGETWCGVEQGTTGLEHALIHGNPLRGVVRVAAAGEPDELRRCVTLGVGALAVEMLPANGIVRPDSPEPVRALERRIRDTFDPRRILNPGIMGPDA